MLNEKIYTTIKSPVISEKAAIEKSTSNTYVFKVAKEATKDEIKNSIEEIFGVKVESVRVLNTKFKNKRTRLGKYKKLHKEDQQKDGKKSISINTVKV